MSLTWWCPPAGLCGNFNSNQADDFLKLSGVQDATAAGFVNSWKTHASCTDIQRIFQNPCSLSLDNGKSDSFECVSVITVASSESPNLLLCVTDREVRPALVLHAEWSSGSVRPLSPRDQSWLLQRGEVSHIFVDCTQTSLWWALTVLFLYCVSSQNCMYDSCNCERSEDCMCAAVSSYVHACAAAGIQISGWRKSICGE